MATSRLPTLYLPHGGGPCFYMDWTMGPADTWDRMAAWLRGLAATLPARPTAMIVVSAHWEAPVPTVQTAAAPPLLYDYYGFPPATYQLTWPAPGAPALAERVRGLLADAGMDSAGDGERGFDHGVFVPLKLVFPDADIPTIQLSLRRGLDPAEHLAIGRALGPLRDEGVYLVGSGMSYHNMARFNRKSSLAPSQRFDGWLAETVALAASQRDARLTAWSEAPAARDCHPREEHLLPLMVVAGAAGDDAGRVVFRDQVMGVAVSALEFG
jgi:aromatic ring-opening dioxygenase catalytic subunit (LigB family)